MERKKGQVHEVSEKELREKLGGEKRTSTRHEAKLEIDIPLASWDQAKRALDMGFMISFAGNITFPKAQQIRDAALEVPLDRMFIETDCPYLAPIPYRGKRNEPAFVKETARKIGELRGLSTEEIGEQTFRNFYNFFKISEITEKQDPSR